MKELSLLTEKLALIRDLTLRLEREEGFGRTLKEAYHMGAFPVLRVMRLTGQPPAVVMEQCLLLQRCGILEQSMPTQDPFEAYFHLSVKGLAYRSLLRELDLIP